MVSDLESIRTASRSRIMRAIRKKNTQPELIVRRLLHAIGYRFRLHRHDLPGSPDIVLPRYAAAIMVHGCFWHQHEGCSKGVLPRSRTDYWWPKLRRNIERDRKALAALPSLGWRVLIVWECEIADLAALRLRIADFLAEGRDPA